MASQRGNGVVHTLTGPVYAVGFLFVLLPIVDTFAQVWPLSFGNPTWRYGTVGIGANYLISVLFGMLLLCLVAGQGGHRRTLKVLMWLNLLGAVVALAGTASFVLDALQVRATIPRDNAQAMRMFNIGAEKAVLKYLLSEVVLLWLAFSCWRVVRQMPSAAAEEKVPKLVSTQTDK